MLVHGNKTQPVAGRNRKPAVGGQRRPLSNVPTALNTKKLFERTEDTLKKAIEVESEGFYHE